MGIKDFIEDAAGAVAAVEGLEALDPNANLLEKGAAAVAGYEGADFLKDKLGQLLGGGEQAAPAANADQPDLAQDFSGDDSQNG